MDRRFTVINELPSTVGGLRYYPSSGVSKYSLVVRFNMDEGKSWVGVFGGGEGANFYTGVNAPKDANWALAVAGGKGFIVKIDAPDDCIDLGFGPVLDAISTNSALVVLVGFTEIAACDMHGIMWVTKRLSWDGIRNVQVRNGLISGEGWDAPSDKWLSFEIDIKSGQHRGGALAP